MLEGGCFVAVGFCNGLEMERDRGFQERKKNRMDC